MDKHDFRVQFPLWNIVLWMILGIWIYGIIYFVDMANNNFAGVFEIVDKEVVINWFYPGLISLIIGSVLLIIFFIAYFIRLRKHNREFPNHQMTAITFVKPGEFLDDDEMLKTVTQNTTKKIYILYSQLLPITIFLMVVPLHRYMFILALILLLIIHNALYYVEIRKYINGNYQFGPEKNKITEKKLQKATLYSSIVLVILLSVFVVFKIVDLDRDSEKNMKIAENCIDRGGTVVFEEHGLFSVSSVTCETD